MTDAPVNDQLLARTLSQLKSHPDDRNAWETLHRLCWRTAYVTIWRIVGANEDLVQSLTQDVFVRLALYRPFTRIKSPEHFRHYLRVISRNEAHRYWREQLRRADPKIRKGLHDAVAAAAEAEMRTSDATDLSDALAVARKKLEPEEAKLFEMVLRGYTIGEMASSLDLAYNAVATRVSRLRERLRDLLREGGVESV